MDSIEIKTRNAQVYSSKHSKNYRNEKLCASRCGKGSQYGHRGKLKAIKQKETTSRKLENKVQILKGNINNVGEMNYSNDHMR